MKTQALFVTITFATLGAFSGTALAGPDFSMIERGRTAKKAEQVQPSTAAKKCFSNEVTAPVPSK